MKGEKQTLFSKLHKQHLAQAPSLGYILALSKPSDTMSLFTFFFFFKIQFGSANPVV